MKILIILGKTLQCGFGTSSRAQRETWLKEVEKAVNIFPSLLICRNRQDLVRIEVGAVEKGALADGPGLFGTRRPDCLELEFFPTKTGQKNYASLSATSACAAPPLLVY